MDDAVHAMIMAFSVLVFVIGLSLAVHMLQVVTNTSEDLLYYADEQNFYDNLKIEDGTEVSEREVDTDTVILTLYRYYKENFCVKIYDASNNLLQNFDVNLEGEVRQLAAINNNNRTKKQKALHTIYNDNAKASYLFEAPWIGSTDEDMKARIDYFINGSKGYINNSLVNYEDAQYSKFYKMREHNKVASDADKIYFKEQFIRYTYTGETMENEDGDILVEGAQPKDKIVIIYTATKNP